MIPVVDISYFIKLAVRTTFSAIFSKAAAILLIGVLISAFFQIGYFVLLDKLTDFIAQQVIIDDSIGENITNSPFWVILFDVFNLEFLLIGLTIILGIALEFIVLIPAFVGVVFSGVFVYGGTAAMRRLISHITEVGSDYAQQL